MNTLVVTNSSLSRIKTHFPTQEEENMTGAGSLTTQLLFQAHETIDTGGYSIITGLQNQCNL